MADKMKQAVEEAKKDAAKVMEGVKAETAKAVAEVKEQVKPAVEMAKQNTEKAVKATKKTAEKTVEKAAKAKDAVERAAKKAVTGEAAPVVYVQYMGVEKKVEDLVAAAKSAFSDEHPHVAISDLRLYIKPEERAAYYVVNENFAGRVDF